MSNADGLVDMDAMDQLILEVTHNGGQYSQEFDNWRERHRNNWAAIKVEVKSLRERVKELEGQYIKKSSILEELCDLRDYLITLEASRRDNDTRAAVRRLRLSISNIAHKKQLAETEAG